MLKCVIIYFFPLWRLIEHKTHLKDGDLPHILNPRSRAVGKSHKSKRGLSESHTDCSSYVNYGIIFFTKFTFVTKMIVYFLVVEGEVKEY